MFICSPEANSFTQTIQDKGNKRVNAQFEAHIPKHMVKPTPETNTK